MKAEKFSLVYKKDRTLNGLYQCVSQTAPLIVLAHGHNGFYHFGMFPTIQNALNEAGFSTLAFNFSHNGISGEGDFFDDLAKYETNCRQFECEDLAYFFEQIVHVNRFGNPTKLFLFGHSMGGFTAGTTAFQLQQKGIELSGLILLNAMSTLDVRTAEVMKEWQENGVYLRENGRTKQMMPQGRNFLNETLLAHSTWNLEPKLKALTCPVLVAHAEDDEAVPMKHGEDLAHWSAHHPKSTFVRLPSGGHTLNTTHPAKRESEELSSFIQKMISWLNGI